MFLAKVIGSMVATQKVDAIVGQKLMVIEPFRLDGKKRESLETTGRTLIAIDTLGAGVGEFVLVTQGSSARLTPQTKDKPVDCIVVGIVDQVHVEQSCVYSKQD